MDSQAPDDESKNEDELVFQDLQPEQPANRLQQHIIRLQQNWPPHWNKRQQLLGGAVISCLLIFLIAFTVIHINNQKNGTISPNTSTDITLTTTVTQILSYTNGLYVVINQNTSNNGQLDALSAQTGKIVWSYAHHNTEGIRLVGNTLFIQTDTDLVAFNATTRKQLWENQTFSDVSHWQADQNILFTTTASGIVTALNATTGKQLWHTNQPIIRWQVVNGIFYIAPNVGPGLRALNAQNGQQLWYNPNIFYQYITPDNGHLYLQSTDLKYIQAFDSKSGKRFWQVPAHGKSFVLSVYNGLLLLEDIKDAQLEMLNDQTGKLLWQHSGLLIPTPPENIDQIAISSQQQNEADILRTSDGKTIFHFLYTNTDNPSVVSLLALENGLAFFAYDTQNGNGRKVTAVLTTTGATIWSSPESDYMSPLQNNTITVMPVDSNTLLSLRADTGQIRWRHTFDASSN